MAKETMGYGPISPGAALPAHNKFGSDPAEHKAGVAMHPGFDENSAPSGFTRRTPAKHKTGWREPHPKVPRG